MMLVSALAEVVSLGAILPFIGVLTAPDRVLEYAIIAQAAAVFGWTAGEQLYLPVSVAFAFAALLASGLRIVLLRLNTRLAYMIGADLGRQIYKRTLFQPYQVHLRRNSSDVISGVTRKVDGVVLGVILPLLNLLSAVLLFSSILIAIILVDWRAALAAALVFGVSYGLITRLVRVSVARKGKRVAQEQPNVFQALQEGLRGARDVILSGTQEHYVESYRRADVPLRLAQGDISFLVHFPRFLMEALGMVLVAGIAYMMVRGEDAENTLPILAAIAFAGQRMLPAFQQSYSAVTTILGASAQLQDTLDLLEQPLPKHDDTGPAMPFSDCIVLEDVGFAYSGSDQAVLDSISCTIPKGARVGIVGKTGAGKSTLVDVLMGLLSPSSGRILVDGHVLDASNIRAWQKSIAHVPQNVYLTDSSFAKNIAFGSEQDSPDPARIQQAAEQAQIADFIEEQPQGYDHLVGENGVRISGGQRQRIGLARALYKKAPVLVLDEATSALDNATEASVMEAIDRVGVDTTIVMIAHRLSTLRNCDLVLDLAAGKLVRQGSFAELFPDQTADGKIAP